MAFTVYGHALLSKEALNTELDRLQEQVEVAADLLGFADHEEAIIATASVKAKAERALALQVNFQIVHNHDAEAYELEDVDVQRRQYRTGIISPKALALAHEVLGEIGRSSVPSFAVLRSRR